MSTGHNRLRLEGHGEIREPGVQVLSFKMKLYLVKCNCKGYVKAGIDGRVYFQITEKAKSSQRQFLKSLPLNVKTSTMNTQLKTG